MSQSRIESALARLDARIDWERRDRGAGWRVDLAPMADLAARLDRPDRSYRVVHVTGSKGKGSVSSMIATALRLGGASVGVYGSPHVERINERIRLGGEPIGDESFARAATRALDAAEAAEREGTDGAGASWFDIVTGAALQAFREAGVDWAVLEVGLGGRLDSTNVVESPEACVVTTIELEHTAILGSTHGAIAREKGGIFKPGAHLVTGCAPGSEAGDVLAEIAAGIGQPLEFAHDAADGTFEERNARVARAVLAGLTARGATPAPLDDAAIDAARLPGRMESRRVGAVELVLDGAHVASSVEGAVREARASHPGAFAAVVAVHKEKDAASLLAPLGDAGLIVATTIPGSGVHLSAAEVAAAAGGLDVPVEVAEVPVDALARAVEWAGEDAGEAAAMPRWVLAVGSLYLVGAVRGATEPG